MRYYRQNRFFSWVLALGLLFTFSCGKKEDRNQIKTVYLTQSGSEGRAYELKVAKSFIRSNTGPDVMLYSVYPGMKDHNNRYVHQTSGPKRKDEVRITLSFSKKSYNELGREGMREEVVVRSRGYVQVPTPETIEENSRIDKYMGTRDKGRQGVYVIAHDDKRISQIRCTFDTVCTGRTMWNDEISIRYDFDTNIFNKVVDLDQSVVSLIDSFKPQLVRKDK
jgi:hypothetical protein